MRKPYNQKVKNKKVAAIICPDCGSENTMKVHRTIVEKLISALTFENVAAHKYYCKICDRYILKGRSCAKEAEQLREDSTSFVGNLYED
jgi:transposase